MRSSSRSRSASSVARLFWPAPSLLAVPLRASASSCRSCSRASLDRRACRSSRAASAAGIGAGLPLLANLVELLVQLEHFFEQRRRHLRRSASFRLRRRQPLDRQQMLDARRRSAQRAIRVVEIRRALEAGQPLGWRRVVVVVGMKLTAQIAEAPLEVRRRDRQLARQAEEREVVAVPAQRQDAAALRAEVLVDRSAGAAAAALERRDGLTRMASNRESVDGTVPQTASPAARHAPNELPQPQVCFAFGLLNTNPWVSSAVS